MISIFDLEKLRGLLKDFYAMSSIRITVFDENLTELVSYPKNVSPYCALIRGTAKGREACRTCDRNACLTAAKRHGPHIYRCHAGLTEAVTPLYVGDVLVGYLLFGHVFSYSSHEAGWPVIRDRCQSYGVDEERLKEAVSRLSAAAKEAGLPKPSERASLTEEQRAIELPFGAKRIAAEEVYGTLDRWNDEYKTLETVANQKKESIDRMRAVSEQIRAKKSEMTAELAKMENRVRELSAARDVSKLNAELAEMEASVNGVAAGDSGKAMQTIQDEIDELNALADTYQDEAQTKKTELNPSDVLEPADAVDELDAYWN